MKKITINISLTALVAVTFLLPTISSARGGSLLNFQQYPTYSNRRYSGQLLGANSISKVSAYASETSAVIKWVTDIEADSQVLYATRAQDFNPRFGKPQESPLQADLVLDHLVALDGLKFNTKYFYKVRSKDANGQTYTSDIRTFRTQDRTPPVISDIKATDITDKSAKINWSTNELSDSTVQYGLTDSYRSSISKGTRVLSHSLALNKLQANTTYHYRVKSRDVAKNLAISGDYTFATLAPPVSLSMSATLDPSSALASQVVMGSVGNSLATFKFSDTANVEDLKITDLVLTDDISTNSETTLSVKSSFKNLTLWQGDTKVAGPVALTNGLVANSYKAIFNLSSPVTVSQNGSESLRLDGDVASFASNGATDNKVHIFKISGARQVTAVGNSSNNPVSVTVSVATGNPQKVLRTKLTLTGATLGATSNRTRTAVDDVATLTFAANPAHDVTVNSVKLTLAGGALENSLSVAFNVRLIDTSTGSDWSGLGTASCTPVSGSCKATFNFSTIPTIVAGTSKTVKVRVDSSGFFNAPTAGDSLTVSVNAVNDVDWGDGTTTSGLGLEAKVIPLTITSVSYE